MKYLKDKPVRDLADDQFLKISIGEADKLVTVSIGESIKGMMSSSYIDEVKQLYIKVRVISFSTTPVFHYFS